MADKEAPEAQVKRFKEAARQAEADDDPEAFEQLFGKLVPPVVPQEQPAPPQDQGDEER